MTRTTDPKATAGLAVRFDNVSIVFGDHPLRALPLMDAGKNRAGARRA
jgi:glycine betaine/proline transport system ATP-binding protein